MANEPTAWLVDGIDELLAFLPIFEDPNFVPFVWPPLRKSIIDGKEVTHMPYPEYDPRVDDFWSTLARSGGRVHPYKSLPEDPTQEGITFSVMGAYFPIEYFETATINQVRRYLSLCTRGERFCDGHIASQFESGTLLAALHRLRHLRDAMP
jgi:hypothetical protein